MLAMMVAAQTSGRPDEARKLHAGQRALDSGHWTANPITGDPQHDDDTADMLAESEEEDQGHRHYAVEELGLELSEWRARLFEVFASAMAAVPSKHHALITGIKETVSTRVEELRHREGLQYRAALERLGSRLEWQRGNFRKQVEQVRSAGAVDAQHLAQKMKAHLDRQHRAALEALEAELRQMQTACEAKLAQQAEIEKTLLQKITLLDGGVAAAEVAHQRHITFGALACQLLLMLPVPFILPRRRVCLLRTCDCVLIHVGSRRERGASDEAYRPQPRADDVDGLV